MIYFQKEQIKMPLNQNIHIYAFHLKPDCLYGINDDNE